MNTSGIPELLMAVIGPLLLIAAIAYAISAWRKRTPLEKAAADERTYALYDRDDRSPSPQPRSPEPTADGPAILAPNESLTEDDIARAKLGGITGSPENPPAPLSAEERARIERQNWG